MGSSVKTPPGFQSFRNFVSDFEFSRCSGAYRDLINIQSIQKTLDSQVTVVDVFDPDIDNKLKNSYFHYVQKSATLIKSAYTIANIFVNIFLREITGRNKISLWNFIQRHHKNFQKLNLDKILSVYCIVIYRNKIIAHHDVSRWDSISIDKNTGQVSYIKPVSYSVPDRASDKLNKLKNKFTPKFQTLSNLNNIHEITEILFYKLPIGSMGKVSSERREIDNFAEKLGVKSLNIGEIIQGVDTFVNTIYDHLSA